MDGQLNIEELKDSGLLELYVLGSLPEEEAIRLHKLVQMDEGLQKEVEQIEASLMAVSAAEVASLPKSNRLEEVLSIIQEEEATVTPLRETPRSSAFTLWQMVAGLALLISVGGNIFLYTQLNQADQRYATLEGDIKDMQKASDEIKSALQSRTDFIATLNEKRFTTIPLATVGGEKTNKATVWYDPEGEEAILYRYSLAELSEKEVYQLWAIYGTEVVSVGTLNQGDTEVYSWVLNQGSLPETFAISIEPQGGSLQPTTKPIMVGNV